MHRYPVRLAALVATAAMLAGSGGCNRTIAANDVDRDRIEVMRADPIYEHLVAEEVHEGRSMKGYPTHNSYAGYLDPWRGEPAPSEPTAEQFRQRVVAVVDDLRAGGWTIVGAECEVEMADAGPEYRWTARGYRFHDQLPYEVGVRATFPETSWPTPLEVGMSTPFHADPDTGAYLSPPPPPLAGQTCIERGEPSGTDHDEVVTEGVVAFRELWARG
jgi:hypothetical protein